VNGEGKLILKFELKEHHGGVTGLAVNKSVTRVVSSSGDKTLWIYEIEKKGLCV